MIVCVCVTYDKSAILLNLWPGSQQEHQHHVIYDHIMRLWASTDPALDFLTLTFAAILNSDLSEGADSFPITAALTAAQAATTTT